MSQRIQRVNELLKREISAVLQKDFEWSGAMVTVSDVDVTQDLKEAKVFVSVLGGHTPAILEELSQNRGMIQSRISKRMTMKQTPVLSFRTDTSAERGVDIVNLLDEVAKLPTAPPEDNEEK